ncbi:TadE/TadG family type IV pilus assembly protein [Streptomyces sp. 4N509B]|uniref:TadE/TadG family type IV pilus assembly protein n=1 Tax=Streptomyces sp. 4N509B TaxID=3457413 RepID=UPI003FD6BF45
MTAADPRASEADRGAASTQLVLAVPVVLLLMLLAAQFALAWHAQHLAQTAASQGLAAARAADGTRADGEEAARATVRETAGGVLRTPSVRVTRTDTTATARVEGSVIPVVPGLGLRVTGHAAGPVERFVTQGGAVK